MTITLIFCSSILVYTILILHNFISGIGLINLGEATIKKEPIDQHLNVASPFMYQAHSPSQALSPGLQRMSSTSPSPFNITSINPFMQQSHQFPQFSFQQSPQHPSLQQTQPHLLHPQLLANAQSQFTHVNIPFTTGTSSPQPINNLNATIPESTFPNPNLTNITESSSSTSAVVHLSSLLDMDSQQFTQINSAELSGLSLSMLDGHLSVSGLNGAQCDRTQPPQQQHQQEQNMDQEDNMTDSFTRFANAAINELNNICNNTNNSNNSNNLK